MITNNNNTPKNNTTQSQDQSTTMLQQFRIITKELKNFTNKVSSNITKIIQAYNTAQENTGKLIENAIPKALTKAQSTTTPSISTDTTNFGTYYANPNHIMSQQPQINTHQIQRPYKEHTPTQTYIKQQHPKQTPFNLNQSVIKLCRCQNELTHSIQHLHPKTTDALNNNT